MDNGNDKKKAMEKERRAKLAKKIPERLRLMKWDKLIKEPLSKHKTMEIMRRQRVKLERGDIHERDLDPYLKQLLLARKKTRRTHTSRSLSRSRV